MEQSSGANTVMNRGIAFGNDGVQMGFSMKKREHAVQQAPLAKTIQARRLRSPPALSKAATSFRSLLKQVAWRVPFQLRSIQ